jgi:hypothetical protein
MILTHESADPNAKELFLLETSIQRTLLSSPLILHTILPVS